MSFSAGTYSLPGPALNTGDTVSATENNTFRNDVATAFNLTWLRNGTAAATADIPMGGFSFTNCAAVGSNGSLLLKSNNGTTAVTIDTAQNVGVGVTPSAWGSNWKALQAGKSSLSYNGFNGAYVGANWFFNGTNDKYISGSSDYASLYGQFDGKHAWYIAPQGTGNITFTQAMTLDASGNLGVGTTSPNTQGFGKAIEVGNATSSALTITSGSNNFSLAVTASENALRFYGAGTERMRIDSSGNLLVGTTGASPLNTGRVRVATTGQDVFKAYQTGSPYTCYWGRIDSTSSYFAYWDYNGGPVGNINTNGTSTAYNTSSDYRLKENIVPMTGALDVVSQLKPCTYTWKSNGSNGQGFIAHELAEVVPDAVTGEKDAVNEDGSIKAQGIDTSFLVATLTAAIQEQQAIIQQLKADVAALKA